MLVSFDSRENLADYICGRSAGKQNEADKKLEQLAVAFLNNIEKTRKNSFNTIELEALKKRFISWKNDYISNMEEIITIYPPETGDGRRLHHITCIPCTWTIENFLSFKIKNATNNQHEKQLIQENLNLIANATFKHHAAHPLAQEHFSDIKLLASLEQLARAYAYRSPKEGELLQIYSADEKKLVTYRVEIIPLSEEIAAFGLRPSSADAAPILLFHGASPYPAGTAPTATVTTMLDPKGFGFSTYQSGKKNIEQWINKVSHTKNVLVTGHSLGGNYAVYTAIDNPDAVQNVYAFAPPKASSHYYEKWKQLINKPTILHFNAPGDPATQLGQVRIVTAVYEGTTAGASPAVEITGTIEIKEKNIFRKMLLKTLNKGRFFSLAHRQSYFDKGVTLWKAKAAKEEQPNERQIAFQSKLIIRPYLLANGIKKLCHYKIY